MEQVNLPLGQGTLKAVLFKPQGAGPFPAIVALHGCLGLGRRAETIVPHLREWGERLSAAGFVAIFPDSFGSRGVGNQCRVRERRARASRERVDDANTARRWLQQQSYVIRGRVSLIGWSSGGVALLWTVRPRAQPRDGTPDFRSAVALYPGCGRLVQTAWSTRIPTLILIGTADDWTPARSCQQMVAGARGRTARASIVTYPGAFHDFDHANLPVRQLRGMAFSADGSGRVHIGTDPKARADAIKRVPQWLAR